MEHVDDTSSTSAGTTVDGLTVGAVARAVGVSIRTLHHWDAIGLVVPGGRTWSGYRLYDRADIARLQRVLVYRELGFGLPEIRELLDDPAVDEAAHLASQRCLLEDRIAHLQQMVCAVDTMMERIAMDSEMTPQQQAQAFGSQWDDRYAAEAEERWGDTDDWAQSQRIKAKMSDEDFAQARAEMDDIDARLAEAAREGIEPGSPRADELVALHRTRSIGRWFEVSRTKHCLIARGYTEDPRFTAYYDAKEPGLAAWLRASIEAEARNNGVDPEAATWQ